MTETLIALCSLTAMEIVLGIDNIVFIAILVAKAPQGIQVRLRNVGISLALIARLGLLFSISWVMGLTRPLFSLWTHEVSGRDLILLFGGLFLVAKATFEIHEKLESGSALSEGGGDEKGYGSILVQIVLLDIVFSLDSVITAVGMASDIWVMVVAMVAAMLVMLAFSGKIAHFVHQHPTLKILALAFLLLIGVMLLAEGMGAHVSKGYIYFAMAFSLAVEFLNMRYRKARSPVELKEPQTGT